MGDASKREDSSKKNKPPKSQTLHQRFESLSSQTKLSFQNQARGFQLYMQKKSENNMLSGVCYYLFYIINTTIILKKGKICYYYVTEERFRYFFAIFNI